MVVCVLIITGKTDRFNGVYLFILFFFVLTNLLLSTSSRNKLCSSSFWCNSATCIGTVHPLQRELDAVRSNLYGKYKYPFPRRGGEEDRWIARKSIWRRKKIYIYSDRDFVIKKNRENRSDTFSSRRYRILYLKRRTHARSPISSSERRRKKKRFCFFLYSISIRTRIIKQ